MSQDNMIRLECSECSEINYRTHKNKRIHKERLTISKFCKRCGAHKEHKETK